MSWMGSSSPQKKKKKPKSCSNNYLQNKSLHSFKMELKLKPFSVTFLSHKQMLGAVSFKEGSNTWKFKVHLQGFYNLFLPHCRKLFPKRLFGLGLGGSQKLRVFFL